MKENTKITKKIVLMAIKGIITELADAPYTVEGVDVGMDDIIDYVDKTIEQLDNKASNAKKAAAKKAEEKDEICAYVEAALNEDLQPIDDIMEKIPVVVEQGTKKVEVTRSKVVARLNKLIKTGAVTKEQIKEQGENARKVMAYKLAPVVEPDPTAE